MAAAKKKDEGITVFEMKTGEVTFCVLGTSPLVFNALPQKTWRELLYPRGPLSRGARAHNLKHDPVEEFRNSVYRDPNPDAETLLQFKAGAFKQAIAGAALDSPGNAKKAEIGRLTWVQSAFVPIWGRPFLYMDVVKQAGIARTPDVRTRAMLPNWATVVTFKFVQPVLSKDLIGKLAATAGITRGIGDGRQEKGTFSNGQWEIVHQTDPRFLAVLEEGRAAQIAAMENPVPCDEQTSELLEWFAEEFERGRGEPEPEPDEAEQGDVADGIAPADGLNGTAHYA